MKTPISNRSHIAAASASEVVVCQLEDEAVLLHLYEGAYHSLDDVGTVVWQMIASPVAVEDIQSALLARYDVEASRL